MCATEDFKNPARLDLAYRDPTFRHPTFHPASPLAMPQTPLHSPASGPLLVLFLPPQRSNITLPWRWEDPGQVWKEQAEQFGFYLMANGESLMETLVWVQGWAWSRPLQTWRMQIMSLPNPHLTYFKVKTVPNSKTQNISSIDIEKAWFYSFWM